MKVENRKGKTNRNLLIYETLLSWPNKLVATPTVPKKNGDDQIDHVDRLLQLLQLHAAAAVGYMIIISLFRTAG